MNPTGKQLRILYVDGPGNVVGTFRLWNKGEIDPTEVSNTFSGDFFDFARDAGARALVIATHPSRDNDHSEQFTVMHRPIPWQSAGGIRYHLGQLRFGAWLTWLALRNRADVAIIVEGTHWFMLWPMTWLGTRVVPMMHMAFWPRGHRPAGKLQRLIQRLNGAFWRRRVAATLSISPEAERQILELATRTGAEKIRGPIFQVRSQYSRAYFARLCPPPPMAERTPFRILFAGRIEEAKGVFLLLDVYRELEKRAPAQFAFEICGAGTALEDLQKRAGDADVNGRFWLRGKLDQAAMFQAFERSHAVVVPTTPRFAEGMNRFAIEGALAGRPVVASPLCHAQEVLGDAMVEVRPTEVEDYVAAFLRLKNDEAFYERTRAATALVGNAFYDGELGYRNALKRAVEAALHK